MGCASSADIHRQSADGNHVDVVHTLMRHPQMRTLTSKEFRGGTALHAAASTDQLECLQKLLALGVPMDAVDSDGNTFLHVAVIKGSEKIVKFLTTRREGVVSRGVHQMLSVRNNEGHTPKSITVQTHPASLASVLRTLLDDFDEERKMAQQQQQVNIQSTRSSSISNNSNTIINNGSHTPTAPVPPIQETPLPDLFLILTTGQDPSAIVRHLRRSGDGLFRRRFRVPPWPVEAPPIHIALAYGQVVVAREIVNALGEEQLELMDAAWNTVLHTAVMRLRLQCAVDSLQYLLEAYPVKCKALSMRTNDNGNRPFDAVCGDDAPQEVRALAEAHAEAYMTPTSPLLTKTART
eukprot:PhM_4_TR1158/c0_g1_i1/m.70746